MSVRGGANSEFRRKWVTKRSVGCSTALATSEAQVEARRRQRKRRDALLRLRPRKRDVRAPGLLPGDRREDVREAERRAGRLVRALAAERSGQVMSCQRATGRRARVREKAHNLASSSSRRRLSSSSDVCPLDLRSGVRRPEGRDSRRESSSSASAAG